MKNQNKNEVAFYGPSVKPEITYLVASATKALAMFEHNLFAVATF